MVRHRLGCHARCMPGPHCPRVGEPPSARDVRRALSVPVCAVDGGSVEQLCSAQTVAAFDASTPVTLQLAISDRDARLLVDDAQVLLCSVTVTERGAWGVASLGAGSRISVALV